MAGKTRRSASQKSRKSVGRKSRKSMSQKSRKSVSRKSTTGYKAVRSRATGKIIGFGRFETRKGS